MQYAKSSVAYKKRSRRLRVLRRRRIAVAFGALIVVAITALLLRPHSVASVPRAAPTARPVTFVPVHATFKAWTSAQRGDARAAVENALEPAIRGAREFSAIVIAHDGTVLYDNAASHAATPASAQKLIVADAVLSELGPQYRLPTLFAASELPHDGAIDGDLWIATSGDPSFRSSDLRAGVRALERAGITHVHGSVVVDPSAVAGEEINPLWNADDANEDFMAATSGASIDEDTVEFRVRGTSDGEPARVTVDPPDAPVVYDGSVTTGDGDDVAVGGTDTPNTFHLSGTVPAGELERFWLPVHGMPQYFAAVANGLLKSSGIAASQPPRTGTAPVDAVPLWTHRSPPLAQLVKHMLVDSDNHYAEQLMRILGSRSGDAGNDADGIAEERAILHAQGISQTGLHVVDGSGLAHANRVSARTLAEILQYFDTLPRGNPLYPLLARGGKDGTLKRYRFGAASGRVRAKSGHLADAASLAGYVETKKHGRVTFAFIIDGSPGDPDAAIISAVDALAQR